MKNHQKKSFLEYCTFHQIQPIYINIIFSGGAGTQHPEHHVGVLGGGGAGGEQREAGRALLLRVAGGGQERRHGERHHQGRRDHGHQRSHRLRPRHDVHRVGPPGTDNKMLD